MLEFTDSHNNSVPIPPHTPIDWRISGYALTQSEHGLFLMVQTGDRRWHFPGGRIELHETIASGITRECREETGYSVTVVDSTPIYVREQPFYHTRTHTFFHSVQLFYPAQLTHSDPEPALIAPHDRGRESRWMRLSELTPASTHSSIVELITLLSA